MSNQWHITQCPDDPELFAVNCRPDGTGYYVATRLPIEDAQLIAAAPYLLDAVRDLLGGWRYIRQVHGDLYGVGWDRAQGKAEAALARIDNNNCQTY